MSEWQKCDTAAPPPDATPEQIAEARANMKALAAILASPEARAVVTEWKARLDAAPAPLTVTEVMRSE